MNFIDNSQENKQQCFSGAKYILDDIIGNSPSIISLKELSLKIANTNSPVIIYGETGTGKELFVQAIHNCGIGRKGQFIAQNCAAIPAALLEGILFGTTKGAFTGAEDRAGLLELSAGGTIYLDELNSMPVEFQAKLLRVIQEGYLRRVGETYERKLDLRVIASINKEPEQCIDEGILRKDLYYRLNVLELRIPELRNRKEDIPILVEYFIHKYNLSFKKDIKGIEFNAMEKLLSYEWPGNVRELKHLIESILNLKSNGWITIEDLPQNIKEYENISFQEQVENFEYKLLSEAYKLCCYNMTKTSIYLKLPRQTLQYKLKKYGIGGME